MQAIYTARSVIFPEDTTGGWRLSKQAPPV